MESVLSLPDQLLEEMARVNLVQLGHGVEFPKLGVCYTVDNLAGWEVCSVIEGLAGPELSEPMRQGLEGPLGPVLFVTSYMYHARRNGYFDPDPDPVHQGVSYRRLLARRIRR